MFERETGQTDKKIIPSFQRLILIALVGWSALMLPAESSHAQDMTGVTSSLSEPTKLAQTEVVAPQSGSSQSTSTKKISAKSSGQAVGADQKSAGKAKSNPKALPNNLQEVVAFAVKNHP